MSEFDALEELFHGNRVVNAFEGMKQIVLRGIKDGRFDKEKIETLDKILRMNHEEYASIQELKSLAQMMGVLSMEEAMSIYAALEGFNKQPLHVKIVISELHAVLLKWKMNGAKPDGLDWASSWPK